MKTIRYVLLLICCIGISPPFPVSAAEKLIMGSNDPIESTNGKFYYLLYCEAFRRIGMEMEYRFLPAKRASVEADAGRIDGEVARIMAYAEKHPNLVRVEEAGVSDAFCAFSVNQRIRLDGWESLRKTSYKVEYLRGVLRAEQELTKIVPSANLSTISTLEQGLKKLVAARTDIYIDSEAAVMGLLKTPKFKDAGIQKAGVMEETKYYAYLHIKHKDLALKLAEVLKQMKTEGVVEQYRQQVFADSGTRPKQKK